MKHRMIAASTLGLVLQPVLALAAEAGDFDYVALAAYLTINFLVTAGLFGIGIIGLGLVYDKFKPWINVSQKQKHTSRGPDQTKPHLNPQRSLVETLQEERQDVY